MTNSFKAMKHGAIAVVLLFSTQVVKADILDRIEYSTHRILRDVGTVINSNTNSCTPITQADVAAGSGVYTITKEGEYCVAEHLTGSVVINADSVCLSLNCHIIDANNTGSAISVNNHQGIRIFGGSITNSSDAGILVENCTSVELSNLYLYNHTNDQVRVTNSIEINAHDMNFAGGSEPRAIGFDLCSTINVESCMMTGFNNGSNGILQLFNCSNATVQKVELQNNSALAAINVGTSTGVIVSDSNVYNNDTFAGILFDSVENSSILRCQSSSNGFSGIALTGINSDILIAQCNCDNSEMGFEFQGNMTQITVNECKASNHTLAFDFAPTTNVAGVVKDCVATLGLVGYADFTSPSISTGYVGNIAEYFEAPYVAFVGGVIPYQTLDMFTGTYTNIFGNADLGARFANMYLIY